MSFGPWKAGLPRTIAVGALSPLFDPNHGDDSNDQVQMKKIPSIFDLLDQQNLDNISESKTQLDTPKDDTEDDIYDQF